ncbi:hypothetical protein [White spot syndrome virus]|uniref:Uncharacterized protein n=3 Tax=White spot syndrome virus TaxID=342409 RepID=A0A0S2E5V8_9VIRU|nr:hypothetical protein [White spot syndrome virus]
MDSNTSILPPSKRPGLNLLQVLGIIITVALIASVSSFIFYRVGKRKYYPSSSSSSELSDVDNGVEGGGGGTTTTPTQPSPDGGDGYVDLSPQKKAELRTRVANVIFQEVSKDQGVAFRRAMNDSTDKIMEETEARINNFSEPFREATVEREVFKDDTDKNFILSTLDLTEEQFKDIVMAEVKNQLENFDYEDMTRLIFDNIPETDYLWTTHFDPKKYDTYSEKVLGFSDINSIERISSTFYKGKKYEVTTGNVAVLVDFESETIKEKAGNSLIRNVEFIVVDEQTYKSFFPAFNQVFFSFKVNKEKREVTVSINNGCVGIVANITPLTTPVGAASGHYIYGTSTAKEKTYLFVIDKYDTTEFVCGLSNKSTPLMALNILFMSDTVFPSFDEAERPLTDAKAVEILGKRLGVGRYTNANIRNTQ